MDRRSERDAKILNNDILSQVSKAPSKVPSIVPSIHRSERRPTVSNPDRVFSDEPGQRRLLGNSMNRTFDSADQDMFKQLISNALERKNISDNY